MSIQQSPTTEQLTYYIRPLWIGGTRGFARYDAVDAETHVPLPGTEDDSEANVRWRMAQDYRHYVEKGTVRA